MFKKNIRRQAIRYKANTIWMSTIVSVTLITVIRSTKLLNLFNVVKSLIPTLIGNKRLFLLKNGWRRCVAQEC